MDLTDAFNSFQGSINADLKQIRVARARRDHVRHAFADDEGMKERFPSGSLARGTMLDPINDVDYVVVYGLDAHAGWGQPGDSAREALQHVAERVRDTLGVSGGTVAQEVRRADPRNHAVKCFLDDPDDPDGLTVDVTPAVPSENGHLLIPEADSAIWIETDPRDLIRRTKNRHDRWNQFVPLIRVLKHWNGLVANAGMISLAVEVLGYNCIPDSYVTGGGEHRPDALSRFFTAAVVAIDRPIEDPARLCGPIQPDLDVAAVKAHLQRASDGAYRALAAERAGDKDAAICEWREVLGHEFPEPPDGCRKKQAAGLGVPAFVTPRPIRDTPQG